MVVGTVAALWRYPVKSMRGEALDAVAVTGRGLLGDRAWALLDRVTGKVASAKRPRLWARLLACQAALAAPPAPGAGAPTVRITLPDGRVVVTGADDTDAVLSAALGRLVALVATPPESAEIERYTPDVAGLAAPGTLTANPLGLAAPPGTFFDYAPLHLLTTATLDRLRALAPGGDFDVRRFRPNLVVAPAGGAAGFVEDAWVGRTLLVGDTVRLRAIDPAPRCVVPTLPQAGLPRDPTILRTVAAHHRPPVPALGGQELPSAGIYAVVERGGIIRRGDTIRLAARG
jgi:uncharacterized protein YcbX